jgi:hypothetical protein
MGSGGSGETRLRYSKDGNNGMDGRVKRKYEDFKTQRAQKESCNVDTELMVKD